VTGSVTEAFVSSQSLNC